MKTILQGFELDGRDIGFLQTVDFEANGPNYPTGKLEMTEDITKAKVFANGGEALEFIRTVSVTCPKRPDGKPNRPLMSKSWELVNIEGK